MTNAEGKYKRLRTVLAYHDSRPGMTERYENYAARLNARGFDVQPFRLSLDPPGRCLSFSQLDRKWRKGDRELMRLYRDLAQVCAKRDVLILFNGVNLHPGLLAELKTFNAYTCFDDPESSEDLSRPVAKYFDACFVGNIAALNQYRSWDCRNIFFRPLGYFDDDVFPGALDEERQLGRQNTIDCCIFCERDTPWRATRIAYLETHLSGLYGRGRGWPGGFVRKDEMLGIYASSKIGLNLHNSTGPVNLRTYALPANGVMQICDNKFFLGQIFELGSEAIGFCEIGEVPELVRYYLAHDSERQRIALAGWRRAIAEYNETAVWDRQMRQIGGLI